MRTLLVALALCATTRVRAQDVPPAEGVEPTTAAEGTAPAEGIAPEETAPEGTAPEGTAPEGTAPEGTAPERMAASADATVEPRVGEPTPLTRREPTLRARTFMLGLRYGLVGTGPTRFVNDVRYGVTDWLELRTAFLPWPASLMARARLGSHLGPSGALVFDAGLAFFDAGFRLVPDTGETQVGARFHLEGGTGWAKAIAPRLAVSTQAHYRWRWSFLPDDDQHAIAVDAKLFYDLSGALAVGAGVGFATTIGTPVREVSVSFVETAQPGMSHLLARDDGHAQSLTVPLTLTYGRTERFDVDLFCTPRVWPEFGVLFGAGVRIRLDPFDRRGS